MASASSISQEPPHCRDTRGGEREIEREGGGERAREGGGERARKRESEREREKERERERKRERERESEKERERERKRGRCEGAMEDVKNGETGEDADEWRCGGDGLPFSVFVHLFSSLLFSVPSAAVYALQQRLASPSGWLAGGRPLYNSPRCGI
jgi:hypothetical protein